MCLYPDVPASFSCVRASVRVCVCVSIRVCVCVCVRTRQMMENKLKMRWLAHLFFPCVFLCVCVCFCVVCVCVSS